MQTNLQKYKQHRQQCYFHPKHTFIVRCGWLGFTGCLLPQKIMPPLFSLAGASMEVAGLHQSIVLHQFLVSAFIKDFLREVPVSCADAGA